MAGQSISVQRHTRPEREQPPSDWAVLASNVTLVIAKHILDLHPIYLDDIIPHLSKFVKLTHSRAFRAWDLGIEEMLHSESHCCHSSTNKDG